MGEQLCWILYAEALLLVQLLRTDYFGILYRGADKEIRDVRLWRRCSRLWRDRLGKLTCSMLAFLGLPWFLVYTGGILRPDHDHSKQDVDI